MKKILNKFWYQKSKEIYSSSIKSTEEEKRFSFSHTVLRPTINNCAYIIKIVKVQIKVYLDQ